MPAGGPTSSQSATLIEILLVEDDDDDVLLTKKALSQDRILNQVHRVEDGVEAMKYLRREEPYQDAVRPNLILLDLNMPRRCGREVLKDIKDDPELRCIPVVILTTSDDEQDVLMSYEYQANSYITKPVDLARFRESLSVVNNYWFGVVRLPPA